MRPILLSAALLLGAGATECQTLTPLAVGAAAPDFALTAATRAGVQQSPFRLSEHRDQTVVIAFFYRARTKG